jgi:hypothetical protein
MPRSIYVLFPGTAALLAEPNQTELRVIPERGLVMGFEDEI